MRGRPASWQTNCGSKFCFLFFFFQDSEQRMQESKRGSSSLPDMRGLHRPRLGLREMFFGSNSDIVFIFHNNNESTSSQHLISIKLALMLLMDYANLPGLLKHPRPFERGGGGLGHVKGTLNGFRGRDSWFSEVQWQQISN